ncbi:hypothetical protein L596_010991 [Steinernema carpocapsae]|uniref:ubiquitinyl hydrolase 1 n=1 Tax=Steinernema carpocapsae TaxID=34508 RepID=A0A4U5NTA6_STECR|nr:hypothetical protein L596_010991 [Steinernema carpocapsae]
MPIDDSLGQVHNEAVTAAGEEAPQPAAAADVAGPSTNEPFGSKPVQAVRPMSQYEQEGGSGSESSASPNSQPVISPEAIAAIAYAEDVQRQEREIETEQKKQPLLSERSTMDALLARYEEGTPFHINAAALQSEYQHVQFVRRDGNCFYRAIVAGLFDQFQRDAALMAQFRTNLDDWVRRIINIGYADFIIDDMHEQVANAIDGVIRGEITPDNILTNEAVNNYFTSFLRLMSAVVLRENERYYMMFIGDETVTSMKEWVAREVEPTWKEADALGITALSCALGMVFGVQHLNQNSSPAGHNLDLIDGTIEEEQAVVEGPRPHIYVLFTPGHYDVLYKD